MFEVLDGEGEFFVDHDWLRPHPRGAAFRIDPAGDTWWGSQQVVSGGADMESVVRLIVGFAADLLDAVRPVAPERVEVVGAGLVAELVRRGCAHRGDQPGAPHAVIECSGREEAVLAATERLAGGGLLVLAGEYNPPPDLDLYRDVHRRGLRLVGVPGPAASRDRVPAEQGSVPPPRAVVPGEAVKPALWYRVALPTA